MDYLVKRSIRSVAASGVVTPEIATLLSGGSGPGIKSSETLASEAVNFQNKVNVSRAEGQIMLPHLHSLDLKTGMLTTTLMPTTTATAPAATTPAATTSLETTPAATTAFATTLASATTAAATTAFATTPAATTAYATTPAATTAFATTPAATTATINAPEPVSTTTLNSLTSSLGAPLTFTVVAPADTKEPNPKVADTTANCNQNSPNAYIPVAISDYATV
ncbi:hypothetical protein HDU81_007583 [Chytriomyces hyalinus]|nr:hypothetical protein HDU81_007583 [Chytriomyces hyalinus]